MLDTLPGRPGTSEDSGHRPLTPYGLSPPEKVRIQASSIPLAAPSTHDLTLTTDFTYRRTTYFILTILINCFLPDAGNKIHLFFIS